MERNRLAIVIPALNESATIVKVVQSAQRHGIVIVVDDGSSDDTAELAAAAGAVVVRNQSNLGYDESLNRGMKKALSMHALAAITMDADGEHDPECIKLFADALLQDQIPLVLGVRQKKQRFAEVVMGWIIRNRYGVRDILCGMKGYRLDLYEKNNGFDHCKSIGTELALKSIARGYEFREIPVFGQKRAGNPRFGTVFISNVMIFRALIKVLLSLYAHRS